MSGQKTITAKMENTWDSFLEKNQQWITTRRGSHLSQEKEVAVAVNNYNMPPQSEQSQVLIPGNSCNKQQFLKLLVPNYDWN